MICGAFLSVPQRAKVLRTKAHPTPPELFKHNVWGTHMLDDNEFTSTYKALKFLMPAITSIEERMQIIHDAWGHPSETKMVENYNYYKGKGFPKGFLALLKKFSCRWCALCKGARAYRHTKRVKDKMATPSMPNKAQQDTPEPPPPRFDPKIKDDNSDLGYNLHADFAHSIALGYNKEQYYLVLTIEGKDFLWAEPVVNRSAPEEVIQEFIDLTGIKIRRLRLDGASEFVKSSAFKAWCKRQHIILCPVAAYTHTLNARAEGAVRICKEHVRCMLRASKLPRRFWPW